MSVVVSKDRLVEVVGNIIKNDKPSFKKMYHSLSSRRIIDEYGKKNGKLKATITMLGYSDKCANTVVDMLNRIEGIRKEKDDSGGIGDAAKVGAIGGLIAGLLVD